MLNPAYLRVLRKIRARLDSADVNWVIRGSFGLALQGVPVEPPDIDIQTDEAGAYKTEQLFSEFVIKKVAFCSAERIRSHFGALIIDGIKVDIMGDIQRCDDDGTWDEPVDLEHHKRIIDVEGMQTPVLPLEHEYQAYLKLGRMEKVKTLRKWLHGGLDSPDSTRLNIGQNT
jgi:hypothetical protein